MICPRCTKSIAEEGVHTCTPTPEWREMEQAIAALRSVLQDVAYNWDCDNDAHKYGTPCRACEAKKALTIGGNTT